MPPQADRNYGRPKIVQGFACYLRVGPQPSLSDFKERLETAASAYGAAESMLKAFSRREAERVLGMAVSTALTSPSTHIHSKCHDMPFRRRVDNGHTTG